MITIFGKIRYHWQPELSAAIIYWSTILTPFFVYLILIYERKKIQLPYFVLLIICFILLLLGVQRYFVIKPNGYLKIKSLLPWKSCTIPISSISKIEVTYSSLILFCQKYPNGRLFHMRKWPKKYFVNALVLEEMFLGEVVLTDHLIKLDYFDVYYGDRTRQSVK